MHFSKIALVAGLLAPLASALPSYGQPAPKQYGQPPHKKYGQHPPAPPKKYGQHPPPPKYPPGHPHKPPVYPINDGKKLAIYWGAEDDSTTLQDVCNDPSYQIVNLAFLAYFFSDGGWPKMSIGNLDGPSQAQQAAGATGLQDGSSLVGAIKSCQQQGKLVILSMGGATDYADTTLKSDQQGVQIANTVWNLFLGGTKNPHLRPFGDVVLDGVDLDNESGDSTGYHAMITQFRSHYDADKSRKYYLTAAPQCPYPDQSIPIDVCSRLDYVWVQFYNNGDCNLGQGGFLDAAKTWSKGLGSAQLFIGGLASGSDGDEGYVDSGEFVDELNKVKALNLPNFGGAMLWEAQLAVQNGNYQQAIAGALQ